MSKSHQNLVFMLSYFYLYIKMFLKSIVGNSKMKLKKGMKASLFNTRASVSHT